MAQKTRPRWFWAFCLVGIIAAGILSRVVHTGLAVFDKYLGDALYGAMVYAMLRLLGRVAMALQAMLVMTVIELFQLTLIPGHTLASEHLIVRLGARLLGTEFRFLDLLAYGVGIACLHLVDSWRTEGKPGIRSHPQNPA